MSKENPRGRFVWHDLLTTDPTGAVAFYTKTVEWGTERWEGGPEPYTMWTAGGTPLGGTMALPRGTEGMAPHWLTYICTPDTDATTRRAQSLGGRVLVQPTVIPSVGRFAVLADPQGALFAPFTPAGDAPGHDGDPRLGEFSWHELVTKDYAAGFAFYADLFAWESTGQFDMGKDGIYFMFGRRGMSLGGIVNQPPGATMPPHWLPYARVADIRVAAERVAHGGGAIMRGPEEVPGGDWVAICRDPQGGTFAVHESRVLS